MPIEAHDGAPKIRQVRDDVTLVGVNHTVKVDKGSKATADFVSAISAADNLLMEGSNNGHLFNPYKPNDGTSNHEMLAFTTFLRQKGRDSIHFLEAGTDLVEYAQAYGIPKNTLILRFGLSFLYPEVKDTGSAAEVSLHSAVDTLRDLYPSLKNAMDDSLYERLQRLSQVMSTAASVRLTKVEPHVTGLDLMRSGNARMSIYLAGVRDYEVIVPRVTTLVDQLPGPKAIVVGDNHSDNIANALQGQPMEKPEPWPVYVQSLDRGNQSHVVFHAKMLKRVTDGLHDGKTGKKKKKR